MIPPEGKAGHITLNARWTQGRKPDTGHRCVRGLSKLQLRDD